MIFESKWANDKKIKYHACYFAGLINPVTIKTKLYLEEIKD